MASPSASSATLSIHSGACRVDDDGDPSALGTNSSEVGEIMRGGVDDRVSGWQDEICGVIYPREDLFVLGKEYFSPAPPYSLSASMRAASHPDERILPSVLEHANNMYNDRVRDDLRQRLYLNGVPMSLVSLGI